MKKNLLVVGKSRNFFFTKRTYRQTWLPPLIRFSLIFKDNSPPCSHAHKHIFWMAPKRSCRFVIFLFGNVSQVFIEFTYYFIGIFNFLLPVWIDVISVIYFLDMLVIFLIVYHMFGINLIYSYERSSSWPSLLLLKELC